MKSGLTSRMLAASAVVALIVGTVFAILLLAIGDMRGSARLARHSQQVIAAANSDEKLVLDLETGTRGFIITGQDRFLAPWVGARRALPPVLSRLTQLVSDNPAQEARAQAIQRAVLSYLRDYSEPLVQQARTDRAAAATTVRTGEGKRRVDAMRRQFAAFVGADQDLSTTRTASARSAASRAIAFGIGGLAGSVLLVLLFAGYLTRAIVGPTRRLAAAAQRLAAGDLSARVAEVGAGEIGQLKRSFNAMAAILEENRDELEAQQAELASINTELEVQQSELEAANEELEAQRVELERTLEELAEEKERVEAFYEFGERLAVETELATLAETALAGLCDAAAAELGTLYVAHGEQLPLLAAARGLDPKRLPAELAPGAGLAGRALAEGAVVAASYGESGLRLTAFGEEIRVHHELHVPLRHADRILGVVTLARVADRPFGAGEREAIEHLAGQAAVALANATAFSEAVRLAGIIRAVLDATNDGIRLVDLEGNTLVANATVEQVAAEVFAQPTEGTIYERAAAIADQMTDPAGYLADLQGMAADPQHEALHEFTHTASGRTFQRYTAPVRDASGALIGRISGLHELTAERKAQQDLEHVVAELAEQEAVKQAVLDATTDGIRLVDLEGRTLIANASIERTTTEVFGFSGHSTLQERSAIAERLADPDTYLAAVEKMAEDPNAETVDEFRLVDSGRCFKRYTAPVRDPDGQLVGRIIVLREVTAEREAERLKSELVATVSHELRTPLASILGFAELLVARKLDAPTRERYLDTIYKEARRLTTLINDFLDLQRIEEGRFTLSLERLELGGLLRQEVELFSGQSAAHSLELELPEEPVAVLGEPDRIAQVIANLISNAIKYSPEGGPVKVAAAPANGVVRVSVADSGLGIPGDQQPGIFTKFFRVDSSDTREIGGTGLGLALCHEIVDAHGGRIGFESIEGTGSTFWFELPAAQYGPGRGRSRILVIEDDPAAAALLSRYLVEDGYDVEVAASGEEGLESARESPPALVALDIELPGELDGWDVLTRLKETPATAGIPVVVCTGGNDRNRATALGAADFLVKPFSGKRLREIVARLLPSGGTVLVVDDEESVRRLVAETLAPDGLELWEAADGDEALALIAARKPDAIVLDLLMPKVDGFTVLERLQEDPETRTLPVVVLTAKRLSAKERSLLRARSVSLLEKSAYSRDELRRLIGQALGALSGE